MDPRALLFLLLAGVMAAVFAVIALRVYRPGRRGELESPKHRMLDD